MTRRDRVTAYTWNIFLRHEAERIFNVRAEACPE
jgi:hypothetical protein